MTPRTPMHILALCASYNRVEKTLAAFRDLHRQPEIPGVTLTFALVDDNSSDGTIAAIMAEFPLTMTVNSGGERYWAGSMRFGYQSFWDSNRYTHLLVFNDDCTFFDNSLSILIKSALSNKQERGTVVVGAMRDPKTSELTYGGLVKKKWAPGVYFRTIDPTSKTQAIDTLNMNFAIIDKEALHYNELILSHFVHGFADFDFGLRAKRNGAKVLLAPHFLGECTRNTAINTWQDCNLPFKLRSQLLLHPKGLPIKPRLLYLKAHAPLAWPAILLWPYFKFYTLSILLHLLRRIGP